MLQMIIHEVGFKCIREFRSIQNMDVLYSTSWYTRFKVRHDRSLIMVEHSTEPGEMGSNPNFLYDTYHLRSCVRLIVLHRTKLL